MGKYSSYEKYLNFIEKYKKARNASSGSEVDSNANVDNKNIATLQGELPKRDLIGTNRLLMINKITEMFGEEMADKYIDDLDHHRIYKHDETNLCPYCVSITMYPFLTGGLKSLGGLSDAPRHLDSFCGEFINLVFAIAAQFAGAVSTPEFLTYLDYFIRKEYGDDYYLRSDEIVCFGNNERSIDKVITDKFEQVVHSLNQPAAARNYQSVFWNVAYFDKPYFKGIFDGFYFPDGTEPKWDSVNWLQKRFMKWFNEERTRTILTFPVETVNLLNDGTDYVDKEWKDFTAEMYAEGHSFFTYTSDSVDSLASCCFSGEQKCLTKSSNGVNWLNFEELYKASSDEAKRNFTIFHNGNWVQGKPIRLKKENKKMFKVVTVNNKELLVTNDHIFPTLFGDKKVEDLTNEDYLLFSTKPLNAPHEVDKKLSYEQGFLIGVYLGDGSMSNEEKSCTTEVQLSLNEEKYQNAIDILQKAVGKQVKITLHAPKNNVFPVRIRDNNTADFIRSYVGGKYCFEKTLNMDCLLQSTEFRKGILDGYYLTDGGNSNRIYTTSKELAENIETLCTSLGITTIINKSDRRGEGKVVIRGKSFNRNYPVYCVRWYETYKRKQKNIYKWVNNSLYFKIKDIEEIDYQDDYVYCFEMADADEPYFTLPNGVISHNCRLRNELRDNTFSYTLGAGGVATGSKGVITINLNRLVQDATKDGKDISEAVREQVRKVHCYLKAYNEIQRDNFKANLLPVYNAGFISLEKQFLTCGLNGFVEGAEFLGIEISPNEKYFDYCEKILKPIYDLNREAKTDEIMINTEFVPKMSGHKVA